MFKSVVKVCGSTVKLQLILDILSAVEAGGIRGVAVKCLDITKNSDCEFRLPQLHSRYPVSTAILRLSRKLSQLT